VTDGSEESSALWGLAGGSLPDFFVDDFFHDFVSDAKKHASHPTLHFGSEETNRTNCKLEVIMDNCLPWIVQKGNYSI